MTTLPRRPPTSLEELPIAARDYLGPATFVGLDGPRFELDLPSGARVVAEQALSIPYRAQPGDVLLVIGREDPEGPRYYVIGVLSGRGSATLEVHGDLAIRAVGGALSLEADKGVRVGAPRFEVVARRVEVVADEIAQRCAKLWLHARERLTVLARAKDEVVEREATTQAAELTILAEKKVVVNGKQIHLG